MSEPEKENISASVDDVESVGTQIVASIENVVDADSSCSNILDSGENVDSVSANSLSLVNNVDSEGAKNMSPINGVDGVGQKSLVIKLERLNSTLVADLLKALDEKLQRNAILNESSFVRRSGRSQKQPDRITINPKEKRKFKRNLRHMRKTETRRSGRIKSTDKQSGESGTEEEVSDKENEDSDSDKEEKQRRSKRLKPSPKDKSDNKRSKPRYSSDEDYEVKKPSRSKKKEKDSDEEFEALLGDKKVSSESYFSDSSGSDWGGSGKRRSGKPRKRRVPKEKEFAEFAKVIVGNGKFNAARDEHYGYCQKCKEGGELVCCLTCRWAFHLLCLNPPLKDIPDGKWQCPRCSLEELPGKPLQILGWRWKESKEERKKFSELSAFEQKLVAKPQREYFIHWTDMSYWKCSWASETQMSLAYTTMWRNYNKNIESDEEEMCLGDTKDPLYERFYKYGVQPQWLTVHRIINHRRMYGKNEYLVKWRGVPYVEASWEIKDDQEIPEFKKFQEIYHEWKRIFDEDRDYEYKHIKPPPEKPISDLAEKFENQPSFVDTEGGLSLHDYQLQSLNWLRESWKKGVNTILADEMGLGKTIQAIMLLYSLYKEGHSVGPFLVCAPLSTVVNWEREFELWAPDLYVVTYTGHQEERIVIRENELSGTVKCTKAARKIKGDIQFHVLLTSYEFITKDLPTLSSVSWAAMVVDEGHRLKNNRSKFFDNLNNYETGYKLILSGTPLQNNLQELFTMLNFLCPEDEEEFQSFQEQFEDDTITQENQVKKLHAILSTRLLRRVKEEVLKDLPTKTEIIVKVELSPMQKKYYKYILTKNFDALNSKSGGHWATLMYVICDLQKCCNHPYLFSTAMMKAPVLPSDIYETSALVKASGKLCLLQKMLRGLEANGNRVLIFSHSVKMLDILEDFLEGEKYNYERIDGSTKGSDRQDSIDRFNAPDSKQLVFLLSTKAGGIGINLATADTVILYDSDWNPHNDIQAFSRAHRIGQKKKVMIYRFITRHSIEERIAEVARKKLVLNHVVLEAGKSDFSFALSKQQLDGIIRYGTKELFKESSDTDFLRDNYTDEAIKDLLDRNKVDNEKKEESHNENDFLSSVKIVSHVTAEDIVEVSSEEENNEPDYWLKILGKNSNSNANRSNNPESFGKGKRSRKRIKYKVPDEYDPFSDSEENEPNGIEVIELDDDHQSSSNNSSDVKDSHSGQKMKPLPKNSKFEVEGSDSDVQECHSDQQERKPLVKICKRGPLIQNYKRLSLIKAYQRKALINNCKSKVEESDSDVQECHSDEHESKPLIKNCKSGPLSKNCKSGPLSKTCKSGPLSKTCKSGPLSKTYKSGPLSKTYKSGPLSKTCKSGPLTKNCQSGPLVQEINREPLFKDSKSEVEVSDSDVQVIESESDDDIPLIPAAIVAVVQTDSEGGESDDDEVQVVYSNSDDSEEDDEKEEGSDDDDDDNDGESDSDLDSDDESVSSIESEHSVHTIEDSDTEMAPAPLPATTTPPPPPTTPPPPPTIPKSEILEEV